ncbi:hypothetical protein [Rhizobium sp. NRK18]|uniref:hypothetical protein n=1 Tax=Rhizobium sp. NRK18 TaxID=2964667 RepID=UPI0021C3FDEC|nr:hypothetical protein [Rhizobium sp. NRK18]MCQ2002863.1 hypothetical protein [Rhizobium sp. NRK18]
MSEAKPNENARNAILGVGIAAIAGNAFATGGYGFWDAIVGILLFFVLVEFWRQRLNSLSLELAYAFAISYVLIMIFGLFGDLQFPHNRSDFGVPQSLWDQVITDAANRQFWRGVSIFACWLVFGMGIYLWRRGANNDQR